MNENNREQDLTAENAAKKITKEQPRPRAQERRQDSTEHWTMS